MSWLLMVLVAIIYMTAAVGYAIEGKYGWAIVTFAWAVSNYALALLSRF